MSKLPDLFEATVRGVFHIATSQGSGTGFLIRPDGLVITNHHVISSDHHVHLQARQGATVLGEVIMADHERDLAAIRFLTSSLPAGTVPLVLGTSQEIKVGDEVIAIGKPAESAAFSLSRGYISALSYAPHSNLSFIQLNMSVNWGNSGSPIISESGNVVGVITRINFTPDGQRIEGVCFGIPIDDLRVFVASIPDVTKELVGLAYCPVCGHLAEKLKYCSHCGSSLDASHQTSAQQASSSKASYRPSETCGVCGAANTANSRYCNSCGVKL